MFNPVSTYRIQFHKGFTFKDCEAVISYLQQLGISTLYASPIFEAVPGSVHGYDCTNPLAINPEIGTLEELKTLSKNLKAAGISWLQDIVPNHMAFHSSNKWLMDVLEKGEASEYANVFDISFNVKGNERLMVPFLGKSLEDTIKDGELTIAVAEGKPAFHYYGSVYPLSQDSISNFLQVTIDEANNNKELLLQLANAQHYRLCHWQETDSRINYRRFFTVNSLICLNIQDENVFSLHHSFIKQLLEEGIFQGLRIDHIDGLDNPTEYLERLRKMAGPETYIIAEKILEPGEKLPHYWPMEGSSGYDFLSLVNNLFTNKNAEGLFTNFYQNLTGNEKNIHQEIRDKKALILYEHMNGELENLYRLFLQLNLVDKRKLAAIPYDDLKSALGEFLIQCPVYRFYGNVFPLSGEEESAVRDILLRLKKSGESIQAVTILEETFLVKPHENNEEVNHRISRFYKRCMQFTGPLMAKGVEDTLMYTNNRFIGHNEVGDSPEAFGISTEEFHQHMQGRQQQWPLSMNATSTHDTKRGEDVRARLNVLTDLSEEWLTKVEEWRDMNKTTTQAAGIDTNDEYLIYQALVGHYHAGDENTFAERIQQFIEKALREAKTASNWTTPNVEYESAAKHFALGLLNRSTPLWKSFEEWQQRLNEHAIINSLSEVLLKFMLPGMPDTYQGCEDWDFSFVDPDNRRPVDYEKRKTLLKWFDETNERELLQQLWEKKEEGAIKLWLTQQLLLLRKSEVSLFAEGDYIPLTTSGKYKEHVFAFARKQGEVVYVFVIPLHTATLSTQQQKGFFELDWSDTAVVFPQHSGAFEHLLQKGEADKVKLFRVQQLLKRFPLAVLKGKQIAKDRGAGILLHTTSLPSPYGIGDLGSGSKAFADFLHRSGQTYWQLLPLNPTEGGQGFSPYSALSGKAGWPLLISLDALAKEGLLSQEDLKNCELPNDPKVDYAAVEKNKEQALIKAYEAFSKDESAQQAFILFCQKERSWLDDFALFQFLKAKHEGKPWYDWPEEFRRRDETVLQQLNGEHEQDIRRLKWYQYVFNKQWTGLRTYCNNRNIKLIGDMPFYVSYDSADVWAAQHLFSLNEAGERTGMAGVPPDSFSADGQLWGMPVFNWQKMKEEGYIWWIQRLRKNIELFDLTRLDHFRAFAAYWQVPANETTAKNGQWITGPGSDFFRSIQKEFGNLPFVAEDLGDINEDVLNLRDEFNLPGMKVLQFAFGDDLPQSSYIPHNYDKNFLAYTGTHDNNTTVGWWRTEADEAVKKRVETYAGMPVSDENIHYVMMRMAYSSVANIAIVPMQDVLGLDETARMNVPSSAENNWAWRLTPGQLNASTEKFLRDWTKLYNRQ